jgi:hypothetical protein
VFPGVVGWILEGSNKISQEFSNMMTSVTSHILGMVAISPILIQKQKDDVTKFFAKLIEKLDRPPEGNGELALGLS